MTGIIFSGFFLACSNQRVAVIVEGVETTDSLDFTTPVDTVTSAELNSIHYFPLKGSEEHFLGSVTKLCVQDNLYVLGNKGQDKIVCYNNKGEFLYEIDAKGAGPEEYLEIANFATTPTSIYAIDNFSHKISQYSIADGKFMSKKDINFVALDIEAFDDDNFLFTGLAMYPNSRPSMDNGNYAVWRTDGEWNRTGDYIPLPDDYMEPFGKRRWFTKNGDKIYFHFINYDGYFTFDKEGGVQYSPVIFKNPWPRVEEKAVGDWQEAEGADYLTKTPYIAKTCGLFEIKSDNKLLPYLYEFEKSQFYQTPMSTAKYTFFDIQGVKDNTFIGVMNDNFDLYQMFVDYGFPKADKESEELLKEGGMCLLMYEMK